jgi:hypothetical protein
MGQELRGMILTPSTRINTLKSLTFTSSGLFQVPPDVYSITVDGCSGGSGGGGGYNGSGGGGGGGGCCSIPYSNVLLPVVPGEILTITIGALGTGGAVGNIGVVGGISKIVGQFGTFFMRPGSSGNPGLVGAGGSAGTFPNASAGAYNPSYSGLGGYPSDRWREYGLTTGKSGGAVNVNGTNSQVFSYNGNGYLIGGGTGNATGGGGGIGGQHIYCGDCFGGFGGAGGVAGENATGYGGGGGGGGGNAAGGNGSPGFIRIYYSSMNTLS